MPDQPNILLILTDQQHWRMMSNTGNAYLNTPAMDRLAAEGIRFDRTYCTNPVCSPSRFSIFTGQMPSAIDMQHNDPPDPAAPLPEAVEGNGMGRLLSQAGYRCIYGGKQHIPRTDPRRLGFEVLTQDDRDELASRCVEFLKQPMDQPFFLVASFVNPHDICFMAIRDFPASEQQEEMVRRSTTECAMLDQALRIPPGISEADFFERYCPPLPPNHLPQVDEPEAIASLLDRRPFRRAVRERWSAERWRLHRWAYARLTESVDQQIGRVLDALDDSGQTDNTVVIFTSDHGDMDASHRMEHKSALYEEAAHVPLIVRQPGAGPDRVDRRTLISNGIDMIPTLCDYAGVPVPVSLPGRSFRAAVEETDACPASRPAIPIESEIGRAIVTDRYKYVLYDGGANREQLYDLVDDPHETRNTLTEPQHQAALVQLRRLFQHTFPAHSAYTSR